MSGINTVQLDSFQQAELANLGCDDLAARESLSIDDIKTELSKLQSDIKLQSECKRVLSLSGKQTALLMTDIENSGVTTNTEKPQVEVSEGELPVAPTTAFNVMRLVQLGYFPKEFAPLWGDKQHGVSKGMQAFYVLPGQWGEYLRTKANTKFQKKFDRDAAYKDFMLDLTKQMNAELNDWFKQNKLSNKANIDEARQSLESMKMSFIAGNNKEAMTHFDSLAEKMGMRVNGKWHEKSSVDLAATRAEQDAKTALAEKRVDLRKQLKSRKVSELKGQQDELKGTKEKINDLYNKELPKGNILDERFRADDIKPADIDAEVKKLQLEKSVLQNHAVAQNSDSTVRDAVAGRDFTEIEKSRTDIGYTHATQADTFLPVGSKLNAIQGDVSRVNGEIREYEKSNGKIYVANTEHENVKKSLSSLQEEATRLQGQILDTSVDATKKPGLQIRLDQLNGTPGIPGLIDAANQEVSEKKQALADMRTELDTKNTELEEHNRNKSNFLLQSEQNKVAYDWFQKRIASIAQIDQKVDALNRLKPLIEDRNKAIKTLGFTEKIITGSDANIAKREQLARDAHAAASPIHDALDRLADPTISRSEQLAMNDKLNELLAAKNPEAERIGQLLKGSQAEKSQAIRELQAILDLRGKGVEFFKSSLEGIEGKIKGLQGEAARIMTEYDRQAGTGDVESLRKKMEVEIGKINTEIERYNADARVKYGSAAAVLTPVQLESLHLQTKLGGFFGAMNKGTQVVESIGSTKVGSKAMRGVYGAMTLAGLGQLGISGQRDGGKQFAIDAADMGIGFIPVVGGAYDILVGAGQFIKGSELTSDRQVSKTDALKRVGFGVLGLIPIAGQAFKAAAKGEKLVEVARKVAVVERTADVTGKVLVLNEAKNLGVALYDATGSMISPDGGVQKTASAVYHNTTLPINQQK